MDEAINEAQTRDDIDDAIEAACATMNATWLTQHCVTNNSYADAATTLEKVATLLRTAENRRLDLLL